MGDVVQEDQTSLVGTFEVEQVEAGRQLLDAIAIGSQVEPQPVRDQQAVGRLMRDDEDRLAGVTPDDVVDDRQRSREDMFPGLTTLRGDMHRVMLPGGIFVGIHALHLVPPKTFPSSVIDLAQTVTQHRRQSVWTTDNGRGRDGTLQRARIQCGQRRGGKAIRQTFDLNLPVRAKWHIAGSGKAVVGRQRRGTVSHQKDTRDHVCSPAAARSSIHDSSPSAGWTSCAGNGDDTGSRSTCCTMAAFSTPVAIKTTARAAFKTGSVTVMR